MSDSRGPEEWGAKNTAAGIAVGVVLYLALGILLWWLLNAYVDPSSIKDPAKEATAKRDLVQALGLIMAGVAGVVGIVFTWRNLQQGQANLRLTQEDMKQTQEHTQEQIQLSREDHQLTRQGQITERFTNAIELLGATNEDSSEGKRRNIEQRLGAVYSLQQIAGESERHHDLIEKILAAYVRHNAPRVPEMPDSADDESQSGLGHAEHDIQAILEVIGRLAKGDERIGKDRVLLGGTDLRNALFGSRGNFEGVWFHEADLRYAGFVNPDLRDADFSNADLTGATFHEETKLRSANFSDANLDGTIFHGADLSEARGLTQQQIDQASIYEGTKLPGDLRIPSYRDSDQDSQATED